MTGDYFRRKKNNRGTTLVEMVVSFALLSIFVSVSAVVISNVTNLYYHVRGEAYARQVGDILVEKISSEIATAQYSSKNSSVNPCIYTETVFSEDTSEDISGNSIMVVDDTGTRIRIFASEDEGILKIYYYPIVDETVAGNAADFEAVYWTFDKSIYNGYAIESLEFAPANSVLNDSLASKYEIYDVSHTDYNSDIVAVYMKLKSDRYGQFNICRFVRLCNQPENDNIKVD